MTARPLIALAAGGSLALLLAAWAFQVFAGLDPCQMCVWQRWPHAAAVGLGVAAAAGPGRALGPLAGLGGAAALTAAGLGIFHTGVEREWWPGPASCAGQGPGLEGLSGAELLSTGPEAVPVLCSVVAWSFAGLSMASWNALLSAGLAVLWAAAALRAAPFLRR